jgi:hypothetical protein
LCLLSPYEWCSLPSISRSLVQSLLAFPACCDELCHTGWSSA